MNGLLIFNEGAARGPRGLNGPRQISAYPLYKAAIAIAKRCPVRQSNPRYGFVIIINTQAGALFAIRSHPILVVKGPPNNVAGHGVVR